MQVVLLRVGIDTGAGGIHGPLFKNGSFEYIPIPDGWGVDSRTYGNTRGKRGCALVDYFPVPAVRKYSSRPSTSILSSRRIRMETRRYPNRLFANSLEEICWSSTADWRAGVSSVSRRCTLLVTLKYREQGSPPVSQTRNCDGCLGKTFMSNTEGFWQISESG